MDSSREFDQLVSSDPEAVLVELDRVSAIPAQVASRVVKFMASRSDIRHLAYERQGLIGTAAIPSLREQEGHPDPEVRLYAAAALLELGEDDGVATVLQAISFENDLLCVASRALSNAKAVALIPVAIELLRTADLSENNAAQIECLVDAVKALGGTIPEDVKDRLTEVGPAWLQEGWLSR